MRAIEIYDIQPEGTKADLSDVNDLIIQAKLVAPKGVKAGDITQTMWEEIEQDFNEVTTLHTNWNNSYDLAELKKSATIMAKIANRLEIKK